jgi:hypothetical protein
VTKRETKHVNTLNAGQVEGLVSYLEIPQLGKLLATVVQTADEGLCIVVSILVGTNIATLSEALVADLTGERFLARVTTFMSLRGR